MFARKARLAVLAAVVFVVAIPGEALAGDIVVGSSRTFEPAELQGDTSCLVSGTGDCSPLLADETDAAGPHLRANTGAGSAPPADGASIDGRASFMVSGRIRENGDVDGLDGDVTVAGRWRRLMGDGGSSVPAGACTMEVRLKAVLTVGDRAPIERMLNDTLGPEECYPPNASDKPFEDFSLTFDDVHFRKGETYSLSILAQGLALVQGNGGAHADIEVYLDTSTTGVSFPPPPYFSLDPGQSELIINPTQFAPGGEYTLPVYTVTSLNGFEGRVRQSSNFCAANPAVFTYSVCPVPAVVALGPGGSAVVRSRIRFTQPNLIPSRTQKVELRSETAPGGAQTHVQTIRFVRFAECQNVRRVRPGGAQSFNWELGAGVPGASAARARSSSGRPLELALSAAQSELPRGWRFGVTPGIGQRFVLDPGERRNVRVRIRAPRRADEGDRVVLALQATNQATGAVMWHFVYVVAIDNRGPRFHSKPRTTRRRKSRMVTVDVSDPVLGVDSVTLLHRKKGARRFKRTRMSPQRGNLLGRTRFSAMVRGAGHIEYRVRASDGGGNRSSTRLFG